MFSYEANRINNRGYIGYIDAYSPEWGYMHYFNNRDGIIDSLKNFGAVKWSDFEYDPVEGRHTSLSKVTEDALLEALKTRLVDYERIPLDVEKNPNPQFIGGI